MIPVVFVNSEKALWRIGGRTVMDRILELLSREGHPAYAVVCNDEIFDSVASELRSMSRQSRALKASSWIEELPGDQELLLLVDGEVVYDPRLIHLAIKWTVPTILVDSNPRVSQPGRPSFDGKAFVGLLAVRPPDASQMGGNDSSRDFPDYLETFRGDVVDVDALPSYSVPHRRGILHYWVQVTGQPDVKIAKKLLVDAGGKGHQELAVLIFNRPVETFLSYYFSDWRITPNQITVVGTLIGCGATICFALGYFWWGILIALAAEVLDGLDGRQARIQIKTSKLGEYEHVLDKIVEISWMIALGWFFSDGFSDELYLWATLGWILFHNLDNLSYSVFRAKRGIVIDEASKLDAAIRLFASNRNNNILFLLVGLAIGFPLEAYWFIMAWSVLTPVVHWIRLVILLNRPADTAHPAN